MPPPKTEGNRELLVCGDDARGAESYLTEPLVEILMSTHNGEKFLEQQMESLVAQTYKNWRLIVRDDASSDSSVRIIKEYCRRYPDKITLVIDENGQLGACQCFARVLVHATADYMMFCDQDDFWLPQKVELSVNEILRLENENPGTPILVFTDLTVVDQDLSVLSNSLWHYQRIDPRHTSLNVLIFDNVATGCTIIFNRLLKEISEPIPVEALMHDWWLTLVCSIHGRVGFLSDRTVLYRQHGRNDLGAQNYSLAFRARRFWKAPMVFFSRPRRMAKLARAQAQKLLEHTQTRTVREPRVLIPLQRYLQSRGLLQRKCCLVRYKMLSGNYIKGVRKFLFC